MRSINNFLLGTVLIATLCRTPLLYSQSIWTNQPGRTALALEILKPKFERSNTTFLTSTLFLTLRHSVSNRFGFVAELPFAHFGFEGGFRGSQSALGNPYLGLELRGEQAFFFLETGFRLPLAPAELDEGFRAVFAGLFTDLVDRWEAFAEATLPIIGLVNFRYKAPSGFVLRLRGGTSYWIGTGRGVPSTWFLLYSSQVGYETKRARMTLGVSGRQWLRPYDEEERESYHQFGIAVSLLLGNVQPGVYFRKPLYKQDFEDSPVPNVDFVAGLNVGVKLK